MFEMQPSISEILPEMVRVKPSHAFVGGPEFAGLVDVNLAGLLAVGLAELLADAQGLKTSLEDASLAAKVRRARESQRRGQIELGRMKQMSVGVLGQIEHLTAPVGLEALGVVIGRQRRRRWRIVWQATEIDVLSTWGDDPSGRVAVDDLLDRGQLGRTWCSRCPRRLRCLRRLRNIPQHHRRRPHIQSLGADHSWRRGDLGEGGLVGDALRDPAGLAESLVEDAPLLLKPTSRVFGVPLRDDRDDGQRQEIFVARRFVWRINLMCGHVLRHERIDLGVDLRWRCRRREERLVVGHDDARLGPRPGGEEHRISHRRIADNGHRRGGVGRGWLDRVDRTVGGGLWRREELVGHGRWRAHVVGRRS